MLPNKPTSQPANQPLNLNQPSNQPTTSQPASQLVAMNTQTSAPTNSFVTQHYFIAVPSQHISSCEVNTDVWRQEKEKGKRDLTCAWVKEDRHDDQSARWEGSFLSYKLFCLHLKRNHSRWMHGWMTNASLFFCSYTCIYVCRLIWAWVYSMYARILCM